MNALPQRFPQVEPGSGAITVIYDKTELYLFRNEQIPGEHFKEGDKIKVFVTGIANRSKKPIIKISKSTQRSCKKDYSNLRFLKYTMELLK